MADDPNLPQELSPEAITPEFGLTSLEFETTRDIKGERSQLGEERAMSALRLGIRLRASGYNIFVTGMEGAGRQEQVRDLVLREVGELPTPPDLVYVHNFDDPERPTAISLRAGDGRRFRREMEEMVVTLRHQIPEALKKESFEREKEQITTTYDRQIKNLFKEFQKAAGEKGIFVRMTPESQMIFVPMKDDGEPVSNQEEFEALSEERN